jgi:hypothetical protein
MAVFPVRQAQCKGFRFDFVGYFQRALDDSLLTPDLKVAQ